MDNVLFYGQGDDASSRRQVRSAAAQYSHRVGPRKPKKSGSKDDALALAPAPAPAPALALVPALAKRRTAHRSSSPEDATPALSAPPPPSACGGPSDSRPPPNEGTQIHGAPNEGTQIHGAPREGLSYLQSHHQGASATSSSDRRQSSHRRLPQYSWTEYPRYRMSPAHSPSPASDTDIRPYTASGPPQYPRQTTVEAPPHLPPPPSSFPQRPAYPYAVPPSSPGRVDAIVGIRQEQPERNSYPG